MADKKPESHGGGGLGFSWIYILMLVVLIFIVVFGWTKPFDPTYLNLEYLFQIILDGVQAIVNFFINNQVGLLLKLRAKLVQSLHSLPPWMECWFPLSGPPH